MKTERMGDFPLPMRFNPCHPGCMKTPSWLRQPPFTHAGISRPGTLVVACQELLVRCAAIVLLTGWAAAAVAVEPPPAATEAPLPELTALAEDDRTPVGEWTRLSQIRLFGNRAYGAPAILDRIGIDQPVLVASHACAPRGVLLRTLRERIQAGYQLQGYLQAQVQSGVLDGRIGIVIHEGPRFIAGPVEITGVSIVPAAELAAALADPAWIRIPLDAIQNYAVASSVQTSAAKTAPPPGAALWNVGGIPADDPRSLVTIGDAVRAWYEQHGRRDARATVAVEQRGAEAVLRIAVIDEGRESRLARIEWKGLKASSAPAIEAALGIAQGTLLEYRTITRILKWLELSGRFRSFQVAVTEEDAGFVVAIAVDESTTVPGYPQPLGEVGEAALRLQQWIADRVSTGDEALVIRWVSAAGKLSYAQVPNDMVLTWATGDAVRFSMLAKDGRMRIIDSVRGVEADSPLFLPRMSFGNTSARGADGEDLNQTSLGLNFLEFGTELAQPQVLASVNLRAQPLLSHVLQRAKKGDAVIVDKQLIVRNGDSHFEADVATGRLLGCTMAVGSIRIEASFVPDGVKALRESIASAGMTGAPTRAPCPSIQAVCRFGLEMAQSWPDDVIRPDIRPYVVAWTPIITEVIAPALDAALAPEAAAPGDEPFSVPLVDMKPEMLPGFMLGYLSHRVAEYVPITSWPAVLARSAQAVFTGRREYVDGDLQALVDSPDFGPIGFLAISAAVVKAGDPRAAGTIAGAGLQRLGDGEFLADVHLAQPWLDQMLDRAAAHPQAIDALAALGGPDVASAVPQIKAVLADAQLAPRARSEAVALLVWHHGLRDRIQALLLQVLLGGAF